MVDRLAAVNSGDAAVDVGVPKLSLLGQPLPGAHASRRHAQHRVLDECLDVLSLSDDRPASASVAASLERYTVGHTKQ